jgi:hypothetical protein
MTDCVALGKYLSCLCLCFLICLNEKNDARIQDRCVVIITVDLFKVTLGRPDLAHDGGAG